MTKEPRGFAERSTLRGKPHRQSILISPLVAGIPPILMLILAFFMPPLTYSSLLNEPDYVFLNLNVIAFLALCILSCYLSFIVTSKIRIFRKIKPLGRFVLAPFWFLLIPVSFSLVLELVYLRGLTKQVNLLMLAFDPNGGQITKNIIESSNISFMGANQFLMAVLSWAWWEYYRNKTRLTFYLLIVSTGFFSFLLFLQAERGLLITFVIALMLIFIKFQNFGKKKRFRIKALVNYAFFALILIFVFSIFSYYRGNNTGSLIAINFLGYGPASFNRLAAVLNGKLVYAYENTLYFLVQIPHIPFSNDALLRWFNYPNATMEFENEFYATKIAGLNEKYIWATLFGYIYASCGVLSFVYFLFYGAITGVLYRGFCDDFLCGIMFYPLIYTSIAQWNAGNLFFIWLSFYILAFIMISFYKLFFSPYKKNQSVEV